MDAEKFLNTCNHVVKLVEWLDQNRDNVPDHPVEKWFEALPDCRWQWLDFDSCHRIHQGDKFNVYYSEGFAHPEKVGREFSPVILIRDRITLWYSYIMPDKFSEIPAIPIPDGFKAQLVGCDPDIESGGYIDDYVGGS